MCRPAISPYKISETATQSERPLGTTAVPLRYRYSSMCVVIAHDRLYEYAEEGLWGAPIMEGVGVGVGVGVGDLLQAMGIAASPAAEYAAALVEDGFDTSSAFEELALEELPTYGFKTGHCRLVERFRRASVAQAVRPLATQRSHDQGVAHYAGPRVHVGRPHRSATQVGQPDGCQHPEAEGGDRDIPGDETVQGCSRQLPTLIDAEQEREQEAQFREYIIKEELQPCWPLILAADAANCLGIHRDNFTVSSRMPPPVCGVAI